jgi:hypothetical protein
MDVMKNPAMLQALASAQAYRIHLRTNAKIGISERGKVRTPKKPYSFGKDVCTSTAARKTAATLTTRLI